MLNFGVWYAKYLAFSTFDTSTVDALTAQRLEYSHQWVHNKKSGEIYKILLKTHPHQTVYCCIKM